MEKLFEGLNSPITREDLVKGAVHLEECYLLKGTYPEDYDPHQAFADKLGCSRQRAKTLSYILSYTPEVM